MKAQQLKNSILQLAIQGKLVPQDPNDEPASELIKRIQAEKEQLIKDGKIKKDKNPSYIFRGADNLPYEKVGKNEPICIAEEVPFEIPDSWEWVRLGNIISISSGKFLPANAMNSEGNIPVYGGNGINGYHDKFLIEKPTLIIGRVGFYCGCVHLCKTKAWVTDNAFITTFSENNIDIRFLQWMLITLNLGKDDNATAQPVVSGKKIYPMLTALPPFNEQQRIVEKIEQLLPYIEEYDNVEQKNTQLDLSFPDLLKKSILQEAIQGKLVPQDPNDEPASELIKRIRAEKEQLIKEKKIKKDKNESYIFRRDNSHYEKVGNIETCIDEDIPFEIPDNWAWCKLKNVTKQIQYGYTASASQIGNIRLLRITDIQNNLVNWENVPYCNISQKEYEGYSLNNRDILIARTGGTLGKSYIVKNIPVKSVFASYLIRVVPLEDIDENYLKIYMESPFYWKQLINFSSGTGQPNVNGQSLSNLIIPLPPLNEQKRIVKYIAQILPIIEKLK